MPFLSCNVELDKESRDIAQVLVDLGPAAEIEIQARTLSPLNSLREKMDTLTNWGLVKRRPGLFGKGVGDVFELTPQGRRSLN